MSLDNLEVFQDSGSVDAVLIEDFERKNNILFPKDYKRFISEHNAAFLENEYFNFFCSRQDAIDSSSFYFLGFGSKEGLVSESTDIINNQNYDVYGYDGLITFGRNGGGDYICFDYRDSIEPNEPKVIFMLHDDYDEETNKMVTFNVSETFTAFCSELYEQVWEDQ